MAARDSLLALQKQIGQTVLGQEAMIERLLIGLLANGNLLVEGLPGLAKTRAIKKLGKFLDAGLSRIQFTPDLLPSDITGSEIYYSSEGKSEFRFQPGPVFNNLVLADEINRAPAKVQAALLEAMEERQVTVAGKPHVLPKLFLVMATQNPIEQEGTYPLPEAQLDRFLMHVYVDYPEEKSERDIMLLVRGEEADTDTAPTDAAIGERTSQDVIFAARAEIHAIHMASAVEQYIVALIEATRYPERYDKDLRRWIQIGASPRGTIGLDKCSRTYAWLKGRDYVSPDDVQAVAHDVLRHRIMLSYDAQAEGIKADQVINKVVEMVAVA
ncbi:MoxR-like ATPase [Edaphobacter aggregans]|uniref:MoxR-like ATPase n=1 Tax=Edaphobacter aggregans TaxID=570835 RepID=A0A428MCI4_9BACT|nr:MoxR family ATPase [Edaphobacter aggregans]RSL14610.1 MoxR-like ATPase [Edaphobacter aggregans]